jgi:transketolase
MTAHLVPTLYNSVEKKATRDGFGEGMLELGQKNKDVVALCADLTESLRLTAFRDKYPARFVEMGVAEQNMATVAAGMALAGKTPFVGSFAVFSPGRNWEQIRTTICYNNVPVKIVGGHAGITVGQDGATHQALEDIALMRSLPNMTVVVPCDALEAHKATLDLVRHKGPAYLRIGREKTPVITTEGTPFEIGEATIFRQGGDITIVACGPLVYQALLAAKALEKEHISALVINCHTIKPIDKKTLVAAARTTGAIVTVEEHQISGGLGSAVMEAISEDWPVPVHRIGVRDSFGESGEPAELLEKYGLTAKHIIKAAHDALRVRKLCSTLHVPSVDGGGEPGVLLSEVSAEQELKLWGGESVRTVPELASALQSMSEKEFHTRVNSQRNDFSEWIRENYGDTALAEALRKHPRKDAMLALLRFRIKQGK